MRPHGRKYEVYAILKYITEIWGIPSPYKSGTQNSVFDDFAT